jgi:hypothetical protein
MLFSSSTDAADGTPGLMHPPGRIGEKRHCDGGFRIRWAFLQIYEGKIHVVTQHSPLERTFLLTSLSPSRLGGPTSALFVGVCGGLSGIVRPKVMGAFVIPSKGRFDANRSRGGDALVPWSDA